MSQKNVPDGYLTSEDIRTIVDRSSGPEVEILDHHQEIYSEEMLGFLGYHGRLVVKVKNDKNNFKNLNFFVKGVPYGKKNQLDFIETFHVFEEETRFYKDIFPLLQSSNNSLEKFTATVYLVKDDILVMEDLKFQGFEMGSMPMNLKELRSTVAALAKLHGSCLLAEHRTGQPLNKTFPTAFKEKVFVTGGENWFDPAILAIIAIAEKFRIEEPKMLSDILFAVLNLAKPSVVHRNAICHADLWSNNLLFDKHTPETNCRLVDFQIIRYIPMVSDLLQLFYVNCDKKFRNEHENELIRHYQSVLEQTIRGNDEEVKVPSFQEVLKSYNDFRIFGVGIALLYLPVTLMDAGKKTELIKDSEGFQKFCFKDRRKPILEYLDEGKDRVYRDRIFETIVEAYDVYKIWLANENK